jgi:hypothetical protein
MQKPNMYQPSLGTGAGGFRVAQMVLIGLLILCITFLKTKIVFEI